MKIKVLWIDDDYKLLSPFIADAEFDGIDIVPFESHEEGMTALMSDLNSFHAVILDAKVKHGRNDTVIGLKGLAASRDAIIQLNSQGVYLPYFIFTGQADYMTNEMFRDSFGSFYVKGTDNQRLLDDIKKQVQGKEEYLIKRDYKAAFEFASEHFNSDEVKSLMTILKNIRNPSGVSFEDKVYFTQIRVMLEHVFRLANKVGLLHDKCIDSNGRVNLTDSSRFLDGQPTAHSKVMTTQRVLPKLLCESIKNILQVTGAAAHTTDPEIQSNLSLQEYREQLNTPYLLYSLTFQLLDVINWFYEYTRSDHRDRTNVAFWKNVDTEWITGSITRIASNGYGTFSNDEETISCSVIPRMMLEYDLKLDQRLNVKTESKIQITEIKL